MKRKIAYIIVILMALFSCSKQSSIPKQEGENYFPQGSMGSKWEYLIRMSTPSGNKDGLLTIQIEGKEKINGKEYLKQSFLLSAQPGAKPQISYTRRTRDGIYKIDPSSKAKSEFLLIPFPLKVGKTWTVKKSDGEMISTAEKIETIEIRGRVYKDCLKITMRGNSRSQPLEGYSYFAPDVGEVTTNLKIGNVTVLYVLDKYKL